jgi:hypothetical protein
MTVQLVNGDARKSKKRTSSHEAAKAHVMVQYYSLSTPISFNTIGSNIQHIIIIISTNCFRFLHNRTEPFVNYSTQTSNNGDNVKVIVLRVTLCNDYRHDLNLFCCKVLDKLISLFSLVSHKIIVIIEED